MKRIIILSILALSIGSLLEANIGKFLKKVGDPIKKNIIDPIGDKVTLAIPETTVVNDSKDLTIHVLFIACSLKTDGIGCISGGWGCGKLVTLWNNQVAREHVCKHVTLKPGEKFTYKWKWGQTAKEVFVSTWLKKKTGQCGEASSGQPRICTRSEKMLKSPQSWSYYPVKKLIVFPEWPEVTKEWTWEENLFFGFTEKLHFENNILNF